MRYGKQAGFWATVAALGLFVAPVQGQGIHSEYTQTPEAPAGGVYQPPSDRATDRDSMTYRSGDYGGRDPDTVSDIQVHPRDLVPSPSGTNIHKAPSNVTRGGSSAINRPQRESQLNREREQRGLRRPTVHGTRAHSAEKKNRETPTGGVTTAPGTGTTNQTPSGITPWVTNPGATTAPNATAPGAMAPGTTIPGTTTIPETTTPGATVPGTTTPGGTTGGR